MNREDVKAEIQRLRLKLLVHSCIYYGYNECIVSDEAWAKWALELERLQKEYPELAAEVRWHDAFKNFDHSTGYDLPYDQPGIRAKAVFLMRLHDQMKKKEDFEL